MVMEMMQSHLRGQLNCHELFDCRRLPNGKFVYTVTTPDPLVTAYKLEEDKRVVEGAPCAKKQTAKHYASYEYYIRVGKKLGWK